MKLRGLILATLVLVVLTGTLYWSERRKPSDETKTSADAPPAILKLDRASIDRLELEKMGAAPITLRKTGSGSWQITQPKTLNADQSVISGAISTLSTLNSERLVEEKSSDLKQYGLDAPALTVAITEKDKTQRLLVGDETPTGNAVYVKLAGDPRVFTMASYHKSSLDKTLNDLRDKRLLTVSADKVSRVDLTRKSQEIEFGRNKEDWQILKPRPLRADNLKVSELIETLASARMDLSEVNGETQDTASAFAHGVPVAVAKITDPSGTQELQVRKEKDTYFAKSSAVEGTYKVDASLGQALDKGLDDFRNKKLLDLAFDEPGKIELHDGSKAYFFTKGGSEWWSKGKKIDASRVQELISSLRALTASKFANSGFSNPTIELSVSSSDGKRVENISIAKAGTAYIAKREEDTALYQLDAASVDELLKAAEDIKPASMQAK